MSDGIKLDITYKGGTIKQILDSVEKINRSVATQSLGRIKQRVLSGQTGDGNIMPAYTEQYAKKRSIYGRSESPVTLVWSGRMLNGTRVINDDKTHCHISLGGFAENVIPKWYEKFPFLKIDEQSVNEFFNKAFNSLIKKQKQ